MLMLTVTPIVILIIITVNKLTMNMRTLILMLITLWYEQLRQIPELSSPGKRILRS